MRNKIFTVALLAIILAVGNSANAVSRNNDSGSVSGNQVGQQNQANNQGAADQTSTPNNGQVQTTAGIEIEAETQAQQQLRDGIVTGSQVQNHNQVKNQEENNQIQTNEQEGANSQDNAIAVQRRSQVSSAVQEMLQIAERNGGIGQQVKTIVETQTQKHEELEISLGKVQGRSNFIKFFIGPNYGEINNAQKLLAQSREQIEQLNQVRDQLASQGDTQVLAEQIQILEQANSQIADSLQNAQKGFSFLGWMFRLFSK